MRPECTGYAYRVLLGTGCHRHRSTKQLAMRPLQLALHQQAVCYWLLWA